MNRLTSPILRRAALFALAALVVAPAALAQPADRHARHLDRLSESLDLTDAQRALVTEAMGEAHAPGALWDVAAALAPTLTDAQKERLFTQPDRADRPRRDSTARARGERPKRGRPNADSLAQRRGAHREAMHDAMRSALNLTDEQATQLDAVRAAHQAQREARRAERQERMQNRPAPSEVPAEIAAILTPEQEEVFKVHRALSMHMHRGGRMGHGMRPRR